MVHMTSFSTMAIYPAREAQIALLVTKKVKIPTEYSDFSDVFSKKKLRSYRRQPSWINTLSSCRKISNHPMGLFTAWARWSSKCWKFTSKSTSPTVLFGLQSPPLVLLTEIHLVGPHQCLSSNEDQERRRIEDGFLNPLWPFRVSGDAF